MHGVRRRIFKIYWKLERLIAPGLGGGQYHYAQALVEHIRPGACWLDLGCGAHLVQPWLEPSFARRLSSSLQNARLIVGIDAGDSGLRENRDVHAGVTGDATRLPFAGETFDLVTANTVFEHLPDPIACLREIRRVLKPEGVFILHTPNFLHYVTLMASLAPRGVKTTLARWLEGRTEEDVFPTYYRLNTLSAVRRAAPRAGLALQRVWTVNGPAQTQILGPFAVPELVLIRLLNARPFGRFRSNLLAVFERPASPE